MSKIAHFFDSQNILWVKLKNSKHGNSFGETEAEQLQVLLDEYQLKAKGLVFSSEGQRFFCAGGNLKQYALMSKSEGLKANKVIRKCLENLSTWPHATACFVVGDCYGGGMELLSAFDYVMSSPASFFGLWQRKNALTFGWQGGRRLSKRISQKKTLNLFLSAKSISSYEAFRIGLIDQIVPATYIKEACGEWIVNQSQLPLEPVGPFKASDLEDEKLLFEALWLNDEHAGILERYKIEPEE